MKELDKDSKNYQPNQNDDQHLGQLIRHAKTGDLYIIVAKVRGEAYISVPALAVRESQIGKDWVVIQ